MMRSLLTILCIGAGILSAGAHDFTAVVGGQKLYFGITNKTLRTVEVTYQGSIADGHVSEAKGVLEIPAKVRHGNVTYSVTAIGPKAFSHATGLTGVVLPSSVRRIGDFAFEGCVHLGRVMFPAGDVQLGQGTFFRCSALKDLSFGSDWTVLDLSPYRWSDSLRTLTIPAKVEKVLNFKKLTALRDVKADPNNLKFSASGGVLYSKDGKTLYGVPRAYEGVLRVKDGTETITSGALADCAALTTVCFPASVRTLSFRETSGIPGLTEIVFRGEEPPVTAYLSGKGCFLMQVANPSLKIYVPKKAEKRYRELLAAEPGEYAESAEAGSIPYKVSADELPDKKTVKGLKNFDKYEE